MARICALLSLAGSAWGSGEFLARERNTSLSNKSSNEIVTTDVVGAASNRALSSCSTTMIRWGSDTEYCLSVDNNEFRNGEKMQLWKCEGSIGQWFNVCGDESWNAITLDNDQRYCVVVNSNEDEDGAKIQLWECSGEHVQQWSYEDLSFFSGVSGNYEYCMGVENNYAYNGASVKLLPCSQNPDWDISTPSPAPSPSPSASPSSSEFVNVGNGACVSGTYSVDSAAQCVEAAEHLWPDQGCYGSQWSDIIQVVSEADMPSGCMQEGAAGGGCSLVWNSQGTSVTSCGDGTSCQVACVKNN